MYSVGITNSLRASHALSGDIGDETLPHEHEYRVEWRCSADDLDGNGFAVDISAMELLLDELVRELDGRFLNELPFFRGIQVSVENLSRYLLESLFARLDRPSCKSITSSEIRIWESDTAWASYCSAPEGAGL